MQTVGIARRMARRVYTQPSLNVDNINKLTAYIWHQLTAVETQGAGVACGDSVTVHTTRVVASTSHGEVGTSVLYTRVAV